MTLRLGEAPDWEVAEALGITTRHACRLRRRAGIDHAGRWSSTRAKVETARAWLSEQWEPATTGQVAEALGWHPRTTLTILRVAEADGVVLSVGRTHRAGLLWVEA